MTLMINFKALGDTFMGFVGGTAITTAANETLEQMITNLVGEWVQIGTGLIAILYAFYRISSERSRKKMFDEARERKEIINED